MLRKRALNIIETTFFNGRGGLNNADEALRYLPISDLISSGDIDNPKILEVGSGAKGITPYIDYKITGVDVAFDGEIAKNLYPIRLSGVNLPFADKSFDYVISVDMLEHVPAKERSAVVTELLRVARKCLFLSVPCGELAEQQDKELDELYMREKGVRYHFFQEHVENGLPLKEELESCIKASADGLAERVTIRIVGNVNLKIRKLFMRIWITPSVPRLYVWVSPLLCIFRRYLDFGKCYRQLFIVDILSGD
jgi:Methyltransferase domain